jgi:protein-S-isoprenylcysteine O-methyltransferase Ste14
MKATTFEFRHRFWIISGTFFLGFSLSAIDHQNFTFAMLRTFWHGDIRTGLRIGFGIAALIAVFASLVRTWATAYLQASVVHDSAIHSDVLVADGPYRHLRNPLYLGTWLLAVSMSFFASRIGFIVLATGIFLIVYRLIRREEAELAGSANAESYRQYCSRVARFFPSILPQVPARNRRPAWMQGFLGESMMWLMAAGIIFLTITLQKTWFFVFLCLSFPVSFALNAWLKRKQNQQKASCIASE